MGEFDLDMIILDTVRRHTGNADAGPKSRLEADLRLSENGRRSIFAFLVEAFSARGFNLPARGFFLSNFLPCVTVGDIQDAVRAALSGTPAKAAKTSIDPAPAPASRHKPAKSKRKPPAKKSVVKKGKKVGSCRRAA